MELGLISKVKEVQEFTNIGEVNALIERDWILLKIVPNQNGIIYLLGRIPHNVDQQHSQHHV